MVCCRRLGLALAAAAALAPSPTRVSLPPRTTSVGRASSWSEVGPLLRRREVSAAIVDAGGAALAAHEAWTRAQKGDASVVFDLEAPRRANLDAAEASLAPLRLDRDALPGLVDLVENYAAALASATDAAVDSRRLRCRVTVAEGATRTAPCPKVHTDNVVLRALAPVLGPGTVCVQESPIPFTPRTFLQTCPGDILLLKGRLWRGGSPALHRSPDPIDGRRVLVAIDRLQDVSS